MLGFLRICVIYSFCSSYYRRTYSSARLIVFQLKNLAWGFSASVWSVWLTKFYSNFWTNKVYLCTSNLCRAPCWRTPLIPIFIFPLRNDIPTTATTLEQLCTICIQRCNAQIGNHCVKFKKSFMSTLRVWALRTVQILVDWFFGPAVSVSQLSLQSCRHLIEFLQLSKN